MVKKNIGILYALSNKMWLNMLKCGLTTQKLQKRISNLQTSLYIDCEIISYTNELVNCKIYEYLLKKILNNYRIRKDREFYNVEPEEIKEIFNNFNFINSILNTEEKLNEYIKNNYPEYFKNSKKRTYSQMCSSESSTDKKKLKRRKGLYIDTSNDKDENIN